MEIRCFIVASGSVRLGTPDEGPPEEVRFVVAPMSEGRERPERLGVSEYHILFDPLWVGQHNPSQGCPTRKGSCFFVALFTPIHRALPSNGGYDKSDLSEVLTALSDLSDLSDEGTYKVVTDVDTALAFALTLLRVDGFSSYLTATHHNWL